MSGYRPKSLGELNEMYDKTITAEKAIIKATKIISAEEKKLSETVSLPEIPMPEAQPTVPEISTEVDSLIASYNVETSSSSEKKETKNTSVQPVFTKKPEIKHTAKPSVTTSSPEKSIEEAQKKFKTESFSQPKNMSLYSIETPDDVKEKLSAKSDERAELFDDYMKIMNDEDDESFSKHDSKRKKKKDKKQGKKGLFFKKEPVSEINDDYHEDSDLFSENLYSQPEENDSHEEPLQEVIYESPLPVSFSDTKVIYDSKKEDFEEIIEENPDNSVEVIETEESEEVAEDCQSSSEEVENEIIDEFNNEESNDIYSFDPNKVNTIPEYARKNFELSDDEDQEPVPISESVDDESYENSEDIYNEPYNEEEQAEKNKPGLLVGKIILSVVLVVLIFASLTTVFINVVLGVNTGTAFRNQYLFTSNETSDIANIYENDLVVSENRFAEDGEVFAYIDYTDQCFKFALKSGSMVNDDGAVLFVAENGTERLLVHKDDTRGVVSKAYSSVGLIAKICTDNFIVIISVLLIACLLIVILLAFVLKDKEKKQKQIVYESDDEENPLYQEKDENIEEENENDLFSSID